MQRRQFLISSFSVLALVPLTLTKTASLPLYPKIRHQLADSLSFESMDHLGNVYRIDSEDFRLSLLDKQVGEVWSIEGFDGGNPKLNFPTKMISDLNQRVYIIDKEPNVIKYIKPGSQDLKALHVKRDESIVINDILCNSDGTLYIADAFNHRILHVNKKGVVLNSIGALGDKEGDFNFPKVLRRDPWGNIHVLEVGNNRISIINTHGKIATSYGSSGNKRGQFVQLSDFQIDSQGNVFTLDRSSREIQCFSPNGSVNAINIFQDKQLDGIPQYLTLNHENTLTVHTLLSSQGECNV